MYRTTRLFLFSLFIISIVSQREKKKTCIHNLIINGTNLLTSHRKQLIVVGITNFNNQSSRIQANRYEFYLEYQREEEKKQDFLDVDIMIYTVNFNTMIFVIPLFVLY